jgi:PAS domain S-box-containing protein
MKLAKMKSRELLDLCIVLIVAAILSIFSISIHTIGRLFSFFSAYTDLPLAEFLINVSFLSLTGLLWITYIRWRKAAKRQAELENIISCISPDILLVVDSDGIIMECNDSLKRMFGYEVSELINRKTDFLYFDWRSNQSDQDDRHEIYDMLERDSFHIGFATGKKKNGETIPLEIITGNLSGRGGAVQLLRDITERKRAEEVLRESEGRFRRFASTVTDVIYRYDPRNNQYDFISPSFELQTGYSLEEIKSDPSGVTRKITHPDDAERVFREVADHIRRGPETGPFCTEYRVICKDGRVIWVSDCKDIEFTPDGKIHRINGILRDITERKQAEEKLKDYTHQIEEKNLELKAKNLELTATRAQLVQKEKLQALGQMASGVAHDFNNLLSIILGRAQLLQRKAKDLETEKGLRSIERAALDASSTIKRIQDFARVRKDQEFKWVNLDEVIEDVIALTKTKWKDQPEANGSTIELEVQKDRRKLPPVAGDESELKEVFTNIIFNAVEAMPNGGKIVIRTRTNRKSVFVYFIDSGIGISEEAKQKIFDPFFTTKGVKNTGLGLSVAYGIIQRHQGDIQIEGKQGKGTTVIVRLPVSEILGQEQPKEKESEKPPVQRESANILVIEDEQDVRELLFDILTSANYMVKLASGGAGGLEIYKKEKFDIVFTDLGMPRMSGWEVAKAIKEIDSNTTVLLITGWGVEMDEEKLKENRIDQVVAKPIKVESLLTLVSEIMESKKRAKEPVEGFGGTKA